MPTLTHAAARKELDLLVRTGLGIAPIAPALASVIRRLVGAEGCFIGWFDEHGAPEGFFHDSAPVSAQELFLNNTHLFVGLNEFNIFWIASYKGLAVGNMLNPGKAFFNSNTFNLLFKACHHHFGLDLRVDVNGVTRMVAGLFRTKAQPFSDDDAHRLHSLTPALQTAVAKTPGTVNLNSARGETGHLLVSADGARVSMINEQAAGLLRLAKLFDQGVCLTEQMTAPPHFIRQLCHQLKPPPAPLARSEVDVVGGTLVITANWMKSTAYHTAQGAAGGRVPSADEKILVTVEYQKPAAVDIVRSIAQLELSPLQSRIAMFAATGGSRLECAVHHKVSKEALKKHLREIYAASRCADWQELAGKLTLY